MEKTGVTWMKKGSERPVGVDVTWRREHRELTLEGEPVLVYDLSWPEIQGGGLGGRWISRYYARLARSWGKRWQREIYWKACLELAACRAASRPFSVWCGRLSGEVTWSEEGLLSLRMAGEEVRGDGRPCRVRWGDVWKVREGAPCLLREIVSAGRGWRRRLAEEITRQGCRRREAGDCFLDGDWEQKAAKLLPLRDFCLTEEGVEFAYPQCAVAPAAEGTPVFVLPRDERIMK